MLLLLKKDFPASLSIFWNICDRYGLSSFEYLEVERASNPFAGFKARNKELISEELGLRVYKF